MNHASEFTVRAVYFAVSMRVHEYRISSLHTAHGFVTNLVFYSAYQSIRRK